jgi:hypothetical protein
MTQSNGSIPVLCVYTRPNYYLSKFTILSLKFQTLAAKATEPAWPGVDVIKPFSSLMEIKNKPECFSLEAVLD